MVFCCCLKTKKQVPELSYLGENLKEMNQHFFKKSGTSVVARVRPPPPPPFEKQPWKRLLQSLWFVRLPIRRCHTWISISIHKWISKCSLLSPLIPRLPPAGLLLCSGREGNNKQTLCGRPLQTKSLMDCAQIAGMAQEACSETLRTLDFNLFILFICIYILTSRSQQTTSKAVPFIPLVLTAIRLFFQKISLLQNSSKKYQTSKKESNTREANAV